MLKQIGSLFIALERACRRVGGHVIAALAPIRSRSSPSANDPTPALTLLFAARSDAERRDIILENPILLDPRTAFFVQQKTAEITTPAYRDHIDLILWILQRCREIGVDAYFAELQPLSDLLRHLAEKATAPVDLDAAASEAAASENEQESVRTNSTRAALLVSAYRGKNYPYAAGKEREIKAAREDYYLVLLTKRSTNEKDWAEAARKIERLQRFGVRKYVLELAKGFPDNPIISCIGFEFIKCKTPNAFALHAGEDDSFAIGVDPGLVGLMGLLFHASNIAVYNGAQPFFIDLVTDLVESHYLGRSIPGLEERILQLDAITGPFERSWADWSGYIALRFLVGHEVGHIHLGHLQHKQAPRVRMLPDRNTEDEITAFDHQTEFEADAWSASELIRTANVVLSERIGACTMPAVFMSIMAMIEDLFIPIDPIGEIQRESHPPAWERAQRLSEIGQQHTPVGLKLPKDIERLLELPEAIDLIRSSREFQEAAARTRALAEELQRV